MRTGEVLGLLISGLVAGGGLLGVIWPELYRSSLEEQYTPSRARVAAVVLLLMGLAGLWAILNDKGGPVDFFPA
jgi:hypothetical protein